MNQRAIRVFRWTHEADVGPWLEVDLDMPRLSAIVGAESLAGFDSEITAETPQPLELLDFPFTIPECHVYSERLLATLREMGVDGLEIRPLVINGRLSRYSLCQCTNIVDGIHREISKYTVWTKESLLFWEKRPQMVGSVHDMRSLIVTRHAIADQPMFRLLGWETATFINQAIMDCLLSLGITGCCFSEVEVAD